MKMSRNSAESARSIAKLVAAFAVASPLFMASDAVAQLRTGRQSSRDFYGTSTESVTSGDSSGALLEISDPVTERFEWTTEDGSSNRSGGNARGNPSSGSRVSRAGYAERLHHQAAENAKTSHTSTSPRVQATRSLQRPPELVQQNRPARPDEATGSSTSVPARPTQTQSTVKQATVKQATVKQATVKQATVKQATGNQSSRNKPAVATPVVAKQGANAVASPSKFQLASCPSCNKGISHTHTTEGIAEPDGVTVSEGEMVIDDGTIKAETEASSSGCAGCGGYLGQCGCGEVPTLNIQLAFPYGFVLNRFSARLEAATFWPSDSTIPSLVRTGAVGNAGSSDLFGGTVPMDETVQGLRGEFGWLFRNDLCSSMQLRFFDAGAQSLTFDSTQSNATSIVRPYFDPTTSTQQSISVVEPGVSSGAVLAHATSDVYGGDLLLKSIVRNNYMGRTEFLAGAQAARLSDSISVSSTTSAIPSGNLLRLNDTFITNNRFYGGTLGVSSITYGRSWSLSGMFKLGLGNMERNVTIDGSQTITVPGTPPSVTSSSNGLQARSTNNGFYSNDTFVVSPELNVTLGYRLTRNLEATVGYSFLELPKVVRAADQFDPQLASNLSNPLVGAPRPSFSLSESNFTLHSLNYGLQYRY